jgi:alpha-tubulin suppressor-like RCC1 family protein
LGLGDTITRSSPVQVGALNTWSTVAGNSGFNRHFIALQTNGTLWAWGDNQYGPCATGSLSGNLSSPTQIGSLTTWTSATNGQFTSAAIKAPGTLWVCGRNNFGRLGLNRTSNTGGGLEQVGTATTWKQVSLGSYNSAALRG